MVSYLKKITETQIGTQLASAVIAVPPYFNDFQRQATKEAGTLSGLKILRIINEPTAACLAYGLDKGMANAQHVLAVDLGGSSCCATLLLVEDGIF